MEPRISVSRPDISEQEIAQVVEVLRSGWITQGAKVRHFEISLADSFGAKSAFCVSSCTAGLFLSLKALGVEKGDEIIVPSYSFIATANAVVHAGATPVFADIEKDGVNLDIQSVESALSPRTRGILLVHQGGSPADIDAFRALARRKSLFLIEDAACASGSTYKGRPIGSHSDFVVFSFHPRKILTTGEGGAVLYNGTDENVRNMLGMMRMHGMSLSDFERHGKGATFESYPIVGYNFRMTDLQAAIGIVQLDRLSGFLARRRELYEVYRSALGGIEGLELQASPEYGTHNLQTLLLTVTDKFPKTAYEVMQGLWEKGIATRRGIMATHLEPCYEGAKKVPLPHTERAVREKIVLPLHSHLSDEDVVSVAGAIKLIIR